MVPVTFAANTSALVVYARTNAPDSTAELLTVKATSPGLGLTGTPSVTLVAGCLAVGATCAGNIECCSMSCTGNTCL